MGKKNVTKPKPTPPKVAETPKMTAATVSQLKEILRTLPEQARIYMGIDEMVYVHLSGAYFAEINLNGY